MHPRYPAPFATKTFSDESKLAEWLNVTCWYALDSARQDNLPALEFDLVHAAYSGLKTPTAQEMSAAEETTGHDVVAFLSVIEERLPPVCKRHLHYGLTSSDLVETAHHAMLAKHAQLMVLLLTDVLGKLRRWEGQWTVRAGRTHGQVADVTSLGHQMRVHYDTISRIRGEISEFAHDRIIKSAGPTGNSLLRRGADIRIAKSINGRVIRSTQIIPRDFQVQWASLYLRLVGVLENIALLVRLGSRTGVGELREGAERIGSSAMPHKSNPIESEKVCGLARVARGYFSTIAENVAFWEDRDISNSSVERISIPDYAAVVEYMTHSVFKILTELTVDLDRMEETASNPATASNIFQTLAQKYFDLGPVEAGRLVRENVDFTGVHLYVDGHKILNEYNVSRDSVAEWGSEAERVWRSQFPGTPEAPDQ